MWSFSPIPISMRVGAALLMSFNIANTSWQIFNAPNNDFLSLYILTLVICTFALFIVLFGPVWLPPWNMTYYPKSRRRRYPPQLIKDNKSTIFGEIEAYRAWYWCDAVAPGISLCGNGLLLTGELNHFGNLYSIAAGYTWKVQNKSHPPASQNSSGFYAYKKLRYAIEHVHFLSPKDGVIVLGTVRLWGNIIEAELGYRAEYARPHRIVALRYHKKSLSSKQAKEIITKIEDTYQMEKS